MVIFSIDLLRLRNNTSHENGLELFFAHTESRAQKQSLKLLNYLQGAIYSNTQILSYAADSF